MCSGSNLDKKDLFSESDPFFTVSRINPDDSYTVVYRSDYIKDEPAPSWPPVTITSDKLCNGDWNRRLKVEIFDYNDRYVQCGPLGVSYLDLLVAVLRRFRYDTLDSPDCMYVFVMYHKTFPKELPAHYGNMSCRVFKRGVQNLKDFCLRINILKGNY